MEKMMNAERGVMNKGAGLRRLEYSAAQCAASKIENYKMLKK